MQPLVLQLLAAVFQSKRTRSELSLALENFAAFATPSVSSSTSLPASWQIGSSLICACRRYSDYASAPSTLGRTGRAHASAPPALFAVPSGEIVPYFFVANNIEDEYKV
jgi:hypothetical protein